MKSMNRFYPVSFFFVFFLGCGAFHYTEKVEVPDPRALLDTETAELASGARITYKDIVGKSWGGVFVGVSDSMVQVDVTSVLLPGTKLAGATKSVMVAPEDMQNVSLTLEATETNRHVDASGNACSGVGTAASSIGSCIYYGNQAEDKGNECIPYDMETLATGFVVTLFIVMPVAALFFFLLGAGIASGMSSKDEIMEVKKRGQALRDRIARGHGQ